MDKSSITSSLWVKQLVARAEERLCVTERLTMTVEEAGEALGIGRGLAYELARTGQIPVIRLGRRMLIPKARLQAMLLAEGDAAATSENTREGV